MEAFDLNSVRKGIETIIDNILLSSGIKYRVFSRVKTQKSLTEKLDKKRKQYLSENRKMQDLIGVRITLYHVDDIKILYNFFKKENSFVDESINVKKLKTNEFSPIVFNLIMGIPEKFREEVEYTLRHNNLYNIIDMTYELQIRTVFSEGWHEVEHDMRYKCKQDWEDIPESDRVLNGILASLENAEWTMNSLFDKLAYHHYKKCEWNQMLRNKMRIVFTDNGLSDSIIEYLNNNKDTAKCIFRCPREKLISALLEKNIKIKLKYDHVLHMLNRLSINDRFLINKEKELLNSDLNKYFGVNK